MDEFGRARLRLRQRRRWVSCHAQGLPLSHGFRTVDTKPPDRFPHSKEPHQNACGNTLGKYLRFLAPEQRREKGKADEGSRRV